MVDGREENEAEKRRSAEKLVSYPEVTIVLPVFRNKETLKALHTRLGHVMDPLRIGYEVLFVDDACPEGSLDILKELIQIDPHAGVLVLKENVGQYRAVMTGLSHARGKTVVVMDADLQDPPEAIPRLLSELRRGPAAVFAGRRGHYESSIRLLTSRLFKRVLHLLCGTPVDAGLFVAMTRQMVESLLAFDDPHCFSVAMIGCTGLPVTSISVERNQRPIGRSSYTFWRRLGIACRTIAKIPVWKLRNDRPAPVQDLYGAEVKALLGTPFDQRSDETPRSLTKF